MISVRTVTLVLSDRKGGIFRFKQTLFLETYWIEVSSSATLSSYIDKMPATLSVWSRPASFSSRMPLTCLLKPATIL
jgi:hypothetical protein